MSRAVVGVSAALLVLLSGIAGARAHDDVELGVERYYAADFEQALAAFARAEASETLTRDDLVRLLFFRALVNGAFGSAAARDLDLLRLASLEPEHPMTDAPPPVRDAFRDVQRSARAQLGLEVVAEPAPAGALVRARVTHDPGGLARRVELSASAGGSETSSGDGPLLVVGAAGTAIEYRVRVLGPGGAVIAERTHEDQPLSVTRATVTPDASAPVGSDDAVAWGVGIGVGVAIAAAIAIVLAIVLAPTSDQTLLSAPSFVTR